MIESKRVWVAMRKDRERYKTRGHGFQTRADRWEEALRYAKRKERDMLYAIDRQLRDEYGRG